jgi:hypothetical protein
LAAWLTRPPGDAARDTADGVLRDFERDMDHSLQRLRGDVAAGETVLPVRLNPDGTLRVTVVGGADAGSERTLVADYLV